MVATLEMTRTKSRPTAKQTTPREELRALAHRVGVAAVARALDVFDVLDE